MPTAKRLLDALHRMASMRDVIRDTHGNVSCVDRKSDIVWIKPSGMEYDQITLDDVCAVSLRDGGILSSTQRRPSVDTVHHRSIYKSYPWIQAICHTHSPYAVGWSMTQFGIVPVCCTEHADYFGHDIRITGRPDIDHWGDFLTLDQNERGVILHQHGVLTFAEDPVEAVKLAAALENICQKMCITRQLCGNGFATMRGETVRAWHERYMHGYGQK